MQLGIQLFMFEFIIRIIGKSVNTIIVLIHILLVPTYSNLHKYQLVATYSTPVTARK